MIYLDYSANTPVAPEVLERFLQVERAFMGNPNSSHSAGLAAQAEMAKVTEKMAQLLGVSPGEIIYTSGASEANNLAIKGIARSARHVGRHIISTPLEHSSVSGCLTALQEQGYEIDLVDIERDGTVNLNELKDLLRKDTILVAICGVDSELGCIQPISEISEILKEYPNCCLHVDATQAVGKTNISFSGIDTMCFTGHKFYGLNGCGVLLKRKNLIIEPLIHGGTSTTIYRSGTPALALAAATQTALEMALKEQSHRYEVVQDLHRKLRKELESYPNVRLNSPKNGVPHILNLSVQGVKGTVFQRSLDEQGVCVSVKSACSAEGQPSRAVLAVSQDRKNALSSWRLSLSHLTTEEEIQEFLRAFDRCYTMLTGR
ncbi:cysteine desulfurase family protein [Anaerotignum sp.]|uniref:cysteine desulfurase family protein n=1 Tax=Anaerotignum sp. TaxID=2039241 RepID=UPI00271510F2|nr:cysteine desulfurase family protein [Anaerotignum sp.]